MLVRDGVERREGGRRSPWLLRKMRNRQVPLSASFSMRLLHALGFVVALSMAGSNPGQVSFGYFPDVNMAADCYALNETQCATPRCQPQIATVNSCTKTPSCQNTSVCGSIATQTSCLQSGLCYWTSSGGNDINASCLPSVCSSLVQPLCNQAACCQWTVTEFQCAESANHTAAD